MHPIDSVITQEVFNKNQASGQPWPHTGRDYAAKRNQTVRTIADGQVIYAGNGPVPNWLAIRFMLVPGSTAGGNYVFVQHDGWVEYFGHLESIAVKTGQHLKRGQTVGGAGDSGNAQGVHLHYEVMTEPCSPVFPWGRYHPQMQINWEDNQDKGDSDMGMTPEDGKFMLKLHDLTREHLDKESEKRHAKTRQFIVDTLTGNTQRQEDVTRRFLADRIGESTDPETLAKEIVSKLDPLEAKRVATLIGVEIGA